MAKSKKRNTLSLEQAQELFRYENGKLYWNSTYLIGKRVGSTSRFSPRVELNEKNYQLNRIVFLLHHGYFPKAVEFKDKRLTPEGMYDISIENLYEPMQKKKRKTKKRIEHDLSYHEANKYFEYRKGRLYWKESSHANVVVGNLVGGSSGKPFLKVKLHGKVFSQHRVVYLLHHGYCPQVVTFKDRALTDEGFYDISIENLKALTYSLSRSTTIIRKTGKSSKYRGVYFDKELKKFRVFINVNQIANLGGAFENEEDSARKYDEMARELIGDDAVLNFPELVKNH